MINKTSLLIIFSMCIVNVSLAQIDLSKKIPTINFEKSYQLDASIDMEMEFYNKKGIYQKTLPYISFYSSDYKFICIRILRNSSFYQTLFDLPNNSCFILMGKEDALSGSVASMKDTKGRQLKELSMTKTSLTKDILGYTCTQYSFDVEEFKGEMWVCLSLKLHNDVGVLKASKMGKYYQTVFVDGFILEISSTTPKGRRTLMKTTAIHQNKPYTISIPEGIGRAVNRIDYYAY